MNTPEQNSAALRALTLLEMVVESESPISLAETVALSGLPKPTVHRLLVLLERAGMLQREPITKRYSPGRRLSSLALDTLLNPAPRAPRHAILQTLVNETGETCNLTILDGNEIVYLDRVESASPLRLDLRPGSRVPLHCTASGKLFLSLLPRKYRQKLIQSTSLTRYTANTITDAALLERELDQIRADQLATDNEEFLAGSTCVAIPVRGQDGRLCVSVAVQAPTARMPLEQALRHLPALRRAAEQLSTTYRLDKT
jgi:IclR family transcriptional regulator, acetate operon repressor